MRQAVVVGDITPTRNLEQVLQRLRTRYSTEVEAFGRCIIEEILRATDEHLESRPEQGELD